MFLASGCSLVARNENGVHRGLMGGISGVGVTARGGWGGGNSGWGGGGHQWTGLQPLRTAFHAISISLQNSLC